MPNNHDLQRFVDAQHSHYQVALAELRAGYKQSHWMWFVFPQIAGLGRSAMAERYAIADLGEAVAYLQHPVLGRDWRNVFKRCCNTLAARRVQILGSPDDLKLRSSMTLFAVAAPENALFQQVLDAFYNGKADPETLKRLPG